jgi:predicted permease
MDALRLDLTYSLRSLTRQPGYVFVAVLSLALGIGVNTAIFSALNSLLLRPLPLRDLDRTVIVYRSRPGSADMGTSFPAFERYRDRTETFDGAMAFTGARPMMLEVDKRGDRREQVYAELVTSGFFSIANVNLQHGTAFTVDVDRPSAPQFVAVLSDRYWRRRFVSDPSIVGRPFMLNSQVFTVVGVAAPGFAGLDAEASADLWIPMTTWAHVMNEPGRLTGDEHWITTVARLRPGVTIEQAGTAVAIADRADPAVDGRTTRVRSARERVVGSALDTLAIAGGAFAVGLLVLVLACTNVANLLMARAAARQREMSVRLAIGGSRGRLLRLYLLESLLLSVSAGTLGLVFASWLVDLAVAFKPPTLIGESEASTLPITFELDVRLFAFALGLSALTALIVGLLAGLQGSRPGMLLATKAGRTADRRFAPGFNLRSFVIALQIALSLILLIPCGLFVRSALNASVVSPGFATDHVLLLPISTNQTGMRIQKPEGFDRELAARVATLPGVEAASVMDPVPLWFGARFATFANGDSDAGGGERIGHASITPGYFATLKIPLLAGRDFTRSDTASAPQVAIVNETLARRFWPDGSAVGRRLRDGRTNIEVVGIAKDSKYVTLADSSRPFVYLPQAQSPGDNLALSLAVRTTGDPMAQRAAIEREVRSLAPGWPIFQFRTLDEGLALQQQIPRLAATLLGVLGAFGLLLAAVGVYGVMAYVVRQRTHEIGIRLALGAPIANVLTLVIRQGMAVCLVGAGAGLAVALAAAQFLASLLYGISAMDPITYTIVPAVLIGVALLACYLPARRITKLQALQALREE